MVALLEGLEKVWQGCLWSISNLQFLLKSHLKGMKFIAVAVFLCECYCLKLPVYCSRAPSISDLKEYAQFPASHEFLLKLCK